MKELAQEPVEITITLKGEEQSFKKKFLEYSLFSMTRSDPIIRELIESCRSECKFDIEDIRIRASL